MVYGNQRIQIDAEDWVRVKEHNWYPTKDGIRTKIKGQTVLLARFVTQAKADEIVTFGGRGRNYYCKDNLKVTKWTTNQDWGISPRGKRFMVRVREKYVGTFDTLEKARLARDKVAQAPTNPKT